MIVVASTVLLFAAQLHTTQLPTTQLPTTRLPTTRLPTPQLPAFLPTPVSVERGEGVLVLRDGGVISFEVREAERGIERSLEAHANVLAEEIEWLTGVKLRVAAAASGGPVPAIALRYRSLSGALAGSEADEEHSYHLRVDGEGAVVEAAYGKGVACGTSTLLQAIDAAQRTLPGLRIEDRPACAYRSVMVDVARQPHDLDVLRDVVRLARLYRLRYVHLHLTDDQLFAFPFAPVTAKLAENTAFGRKELLAFVAYADARGVTLIPEIDLPGHSSRLRESGYLQGAASDRDVADAKHFPRIAALLDEVMNVFASSPYLHIGGDESGAGDTLLPFLARVQELVVRRGRRLIVWEGFHGAPIEALPPRGPHRVLVASWESSYNPPWALLAAGYELINAGWKPLYVVGGDTVVHPGSSGGRQWSPLEIANWSKDRFQHWEPGRPVFEDRGPGDPDRTDSEWPVPSERRAQVLGGQISVWEQRATSLLAGLRLRVPVLAERLWAGEKLAASEVVARAEAVDRKVFGLVQPVAIVVSPARDNGPLATLFVSVDKRTQISLEARIALPGSLRYSTAPFTGSFGWIAYADPKDPLRDGARYEAPFAADGSRAIRACFVGEDGRPRGAGTWLRTNDWPMRVAVQEFALRRDAPLDVPDLLAEPPGEVVQSYRMPMLRGPLTHTTARGQLLLAEFVAPETGTIKLGMKTQSGRASLYLDLDRDGVWGKGERLIANTPTSEAWQEASVQLVKGEVYRLRVDHRSALPRPVLMVGWRNGTEDKWLDVTVLLRPLVD